MTRYLLDTNIVSEIVRPVPSAALLEWMAAQNLHDLYISAMTTAEIERGILVMPTGAKRARLEEWFNGPKGPRALFANRVVPFDDRAAAHWARLMSEGRRGGRPRDPIDMIVAATATVADCTVATANDKDFFGIEAINPLRI